MPSGERHKVQRVQDILRDAGAEDALPAHYTLKNNGVIVHLLKPGRTVRSSILSFELSSAARTPKQQRCPLIPAECLPNAC